MSDNYAKELTAKVNRVYPQVKSMFKAIVFSTKRYIELEKILMVEDDGTISPEEIDKLVEEFSKHRDFIISTCVRMTTMEDWVSDRANAKAFDTWYGPVTREIFSLINQQLAKTAEATGQELKEAPPQPPAPANIESVILRPPGA